MSEVKTGKPPSLDVTSAVECDVCAGAHQTAGKNLFYLVWFFYECLGCFMVVCDGLLGFGVAIKLGFDSKMTLY